MIIINREKKTLVTTRSNRILPFFSFFYSQTDSHQTN